jgi:hypothetical protein
MPTLKHAAHVSALRDVAGTGPPSVLKITGYTDANGDQLMANALGPQFTVTGTLTGFVGGPMDNIYGLLFDGQGQLVYQTNATPAVPVWSLSFALNGTAGQQVTYFLKVAYCSSIHDDSSDADTITVTF